MCVAHWGVTQKCTFSFFFGRFGRCFLNGYLPLAERLFFSPSIFFFFFNRHGSIHYGYLPQGICWHFHGKEGSLPVMVPRSLSTERMNPSFLLPPSVPLLPLASLRRLKDSDRRLSVNHSPLQRALTDSSPPWLTNALSAWEPITHSDW